MSAVSTEKLRGRRLRLLQARQVWTAVAKQDLVLAVRAGLIAAAEVEAVHGLGAAELSRWGEAYDRLVAKYARAA